MLTQRTVNVADYTGEKLQTSIFHSHEISFLSGTVESSIFTVSTTWQTIFSSILFQISQLLSTILYIKVSIELIFRYQPTISFLTFSNNQSVKQEFCFIESADISHYLDQVIILFQNSVSDRYLIIFHFHESYINLKKLGGLLSLTD